MSAILFLLCSLLVSTRLPAMMGTTLIDTGAGAVTWNGRVYEYGSVLRDEEPFDHDALLVVRDETDGSVVRTYRYDARNDESFVYFALLGDDVIALVTATMGVPGSGGSTLRKTEILTFDATGNPLGSLALPGLMTAYNNHGGLLVLSVDDRYAPDYVFDAQLDPAALPLEVAATGTFVYPCRAMARVDGEPVDRIAITEPGIHAVTVTDGAYAYTFTVVLDPLLDGIVADGEYDDAVTIICGGTLSLDGEAFRTGQTVTTPGIHELAVAGANGYLHRYAFVLHPYVANVSPGLRTTEALRIFSNAETLLLDGVPYIAGDPCRHAGTHVLTVLAANGYARSIPFTILPSVAGVSAGGMYAAGVVIAVNGLATLDGVTVDGEVLVEDPGTHELELFLDGEPYATIGFTVLARAELPSWWTTFPFAEVGLGIIALVGLFLVFRKK